LEPLIVGNLEALPFDIEPSEGSSGLKVKGKAGSPSEDSFDEDDEVGNQEAISLDGKLDGDPDGYVSEGDRISYESEETVNRHRTWKEWVWSHRWMIGVIILFLLVALFS
jgi:hypothetical protein